MKWNYEYPTVNGLYHFQCLGHLKVYTVCVDVGPHIISWSSDSHDWDYLRTNKIQARWSDRLEYPPPPDPMSPWTS